VAESSGGDNSDGGEETNNPGAKCMLENSTVPRSFERMKEKKRETGNISVFRKAADLLGPVEGRPDWGERLPKKERNKQHNRRRKGELDGKGGSREGRVAGLWGKTG